jgi:hypothetical protein
MDSKTGTKDYLGVRKSLDGYSLGELEAQILDIIWDLEPPGDQLPGVQDHVSQA